VSDVDLIGIGGFSVLTGLSIPTLRHYDEVGLLEPAVVAEGSGYRRYRPEQVRRARLIRALRAIELPIDGIRLVLAADDDASVREVLVAHRDQMARRSRALSDRLHTIDGYIENGVTMPEPKSCRIVEINLGADDLDAARAFYEAVFSVEFAEEQHGDGAPHIYAAFGSWPSDEFFLLNISAATRDPFRAGRADFGFLVDDLDAVHERAVSAGGTEMSPPAAVSGMPRTSTIVDPAGNVVNLYQNA
jgi:DNA-binding transcriptional MerR regulator